MAQDPTKKDPTQRTKLSPSFWTHGSCVPLADDVVPSSLFLKHAHVLVIDIETQRSFQEVGGYENLDKLGVSVACAYDSATKEFLTFRENELEKLFLLCEKRLVVGYNIRGFDLPVLQAYWEKHGHDWKTLDIFDIMYDLESLTRTRYLKLEYVARGTLGVGKMADGLQALAWWKEGKMDLIIEYCLKDVELTRDIFQYGRTHGFVKLQRTEDGTPQEVRVNWN
jgi:DEAD/DEAH box helicase domain-containing protein